MAEIVGGAPENLIAFLRMAADAAVENFWLGIRDLIIFCNRKDRPGHNCDDVVWYGVGVGGRRFVDRLELKLLSRRAMHAEFHDSSAFNFAASRTILGVDRIDDHDAGPNSDFPNGNLPNAVS